MIKETPRATKTDVEYIVTSKDRYTYYTTHKDKALRAYRKDGELFGFSRVKMEIKTTITKIYGGDFD